MRSLSGATDRDEGEGERESESYLCDKSVSFQHKPSTDITRKHIRERIGSDFRIKKFVNLGRQL